jgi:dUTP pyrophosphatase
VESDPVCIRYVKLDRKARTPRRTTAGASGFDLVACLDGPRVLERGGILLVPTGLALAIPPGYEGQVRARSGLALRHGIAVLNGPGTIDSDYRGPLGIILGNLGQDPFTIHDGDRIAQIVFARVPSATMVEVTELPPTGRGEGGFGHTGVSPSHDERGGDTA